MPAKMTTTRMMMNIMKKIEEDDGGYEVMMMWMGLLRCSSLFSKFSKHHVLLLPF